MCQRYTNSIPGYIFTSVQEEKDICDFIYKVNNGESKGGELKIYVTIAELRKYCCIEHNSPYSPELYYSDLIDVLSKEYGLLRHGDLQSLKYHITLSGKSIHILIKGSILWVLTIEEYMDIIKEASKKVEKLYNKRQIESIKETCDDL